MRWRALPWRSGSGRYLERGAGGVVDVGQYLNGLLEHDSEGVGRAVAAEPRVVLSQHRVAVCVDDLHTEQVMVPPDIKDEG